MSKTANSYKRYPVFFITEDTYVAYTWKANPDGGPILLTTLNKHYCKIWHAPAFFHEPEENWTVLSGTGAKLDQLISHGLASASTSPSPWTRFLTQGLYDPRLFAFFIRPFLDESNKPPAA